MLLQMLAQEVAECVVFLIQGEVRGIGHACREVSGQILCCSHSTTNLGFQQSAIWYIPVNTCSVIFFSPSPRRNSSNLRQY